MSALYLDSSAIVKLVTAERESSALFSFIAAHDESFSSLLARVEVQRAIRRARASSAERRRADRILERIALLTIDDTIVSLASRLAPRDLRSLDAIHLATALSAGPAVTGMITYDARLARAAAMARLRVFAPA